MKNTGGETHGNRISKTKTIRLCLEWEIEIKNLFPFLFVIE